MYQPPAGPNKPQGMFPPPPHGHLPVNGPPARPNFVPHGQFPNPVPSPQTDLNGYGAPSQPPMPPMSGGTAPPTSNLPPFLSGQSALPSTANHYRPPMPPQGNGPLNVTSGNKRPPVPSHFQSRTGPPTVNQPFQSPAAHPSYSSQPQQNLPPTSAQPTQSINPNGQVAPPFIQNMAQNRPNELPVPFHGQGQYSHQVNPLMQKTPTQTPGNSEPTSQKSSRGASPVSGSTIDALEGQFSPEQVPRGSPVPGSAGANVSYQPQKAPSFPSAGQGPLPTQFRPPPSQSSGFLSGPPQPGMAPPPQMAQSSSQRFQGPPQSNSTGMPFNAPPHSSQTATFQPPASTAAFGSTSQMLPDGKPRYASPSMYAPPLGGSGSLPTPSSSVPGQRPGMPPPPPTSFQGRMPPPSSGQRPPFPGQTPPPHGQMMPPQHGQMPPSHGQMPPSHGQMPPSHGQMPPPQGQMPPPQGQMPPQHGQMPPPTGQMPPPPGQMPPSSFQPSGQDPAGVYNTQPHMFPHPGQMSAQPQPGAPPGMGSYPNNVGAMTQGFNHMGIQDTQRSANLLNERHLIPPEGIETPKPVFLHDHKKVNCNPDVFRCTLNAIPNSSSLLNKARLPLGILIHPFRDLSQLPVIQSSVIVRCRSCRTYINPFVVFVDSRRWKCNLCFRVNELPDEFSFDPVSKTYGDPQRRPEIKSATIEFIAPSEYMLRPPQPAVYLFLLDVSFNAVKTGYLTQFSQILLEELDKLPGDARTSIGFIGYDSSLYYFNLSAALSQPQMLCVPDLDETFLPCPDNLLVNLRESKELISDLLEQLPSLFEGNLETGSALGAALQAGHKLMSSTGGRMTIMQTCLPTVGPGSLQNRDTGDSGKNVMNIGPATDFYKKLSLDCSAQQIAVDLFMLNGQFADIATLSCISKYSGGCVYHYPSYHTVRTPGLGEKFDTDLRRYLTRKVGFESVMRIRCTRGLSIHTFHGNFFVRSTDLLSLPNINPDAGFGMQMSIEDNLNENTSVSFQAALLYTSSKGERRIRVHTLCIPVTNQINEVFSNADQQAIVALLAKMAVDRSLNSSLSDARDAMINASLDALVAYGQQIPASQRAGSLTAPYSLRLMPMFALAMLKSVAFGLSANTKLDNRVFAMQQMKVLPVAALIQSILPNLYPLHRLSYEKPIKKGKEEIPSAPIIQLSSANIDRTGLFLMDTGDSMYLLVGGSIGDQMCQEVFEQPNFMSVPDGMMDLPELENPTSEKIRSFVNYLIDSRPHGVGFTVIRDDSKHRHLFFQHMVEDRMESSMSYHEFLQFLQDKAKG